MHILCTRLANEIFWSGQVGWGMENLGALLGLACHKLFPRVVVHTAGKYIHIYIYSIASQLGSNYVTFDFFINVYLTTQKRYVIMGI